MMDQPHPHRTEYVALLLLACSALLFELCATRIFAVVLWSNYAFLVISTALFGFAASGVVCAIRAPRAGVDVPAALGRNALLAAAAMAAELWVLNAVPLRLPYLDSASDWAALALHYLTLSLPFFFVGLVVASLLERYSTRASALYGWDLVGAGIGCYLLVPLLPRLAAQGVVSLACLLSAVAAVIFFARSTRGRNRVIGIAAGVVAGAVFVTGMFVGADAVPLRFHNDKRSFRRDVAAGLIEFTRWSALSRVDVAPHRPDALRIWINGGTNESLITHPAALTDDDPPRIDPDGLRATAALGEAFVDPATAAATVSDADGRAVVDLDLLAREAPGVAAVLRSAAVKGAPDLEAVRDPVTDEVRAISDAALRHAARRSVHWVALPHLLRDGHRVLSIGTAGGFDALTALQHGAAHVIGVEMDPVVAETVVDRYSAFAGGLFRDDRSELVVDEGRSYMKRAGRRFDVIQQVNNFTPIAFANGALNLSETYLLTVESMMEFWETLETDGILCLNRQGTVRCVSLAREALRRLGVDDPAARMVCIAPVPDSPAWTRATFLLKKGLWTPREIRVIERAVELMPDQQIVWAPHRPLSGSLAEEMALAVDPSRLYGYGGFDLSPPTDDRPFFDHMQRIGPKERRDDPRVPRELTGFHGKKIDRRVPAGVMPVVGVLIEGGLFALVFLVVPLARFRGRDLLAPGTGPALLYFACLGFAFILVEICLIQRLVLFLGNPVHSISTVLFVLLVFAGIGSLASARIDPASGRAWTALFAALTVAIVAGLAVYPWMIDRLIRWPLPGRVAAAVVYLAPMAVLMGMPFPLGVRVLGAGGRERLIPWGWAINGYMTVIGSALSVLLAIGFGFRFVTLAAAAVYLAGFAAMMRLKRLEPTG